MDKYFEEIINELDIKYRELKSLDSQKINTIPSDCPIGGVYLFSENGTPLYAGRTKLSIKKRLKQHVGVAQDCPFAWHLTREAIGKTRASYKKEDSRKDLLSKPYVKKEYQMAKDRIKKMDLQYVSEPDPLKQALLEIYVAIASKAKYNDFDTH